MASNKIARRDDGTGVNTDFLTSRKNIVGIVAAVAVILLHFIAGLGVLWPIVTLAAWGAGVALTPDKPQETAPALVQVPLEVQLGRTNNRNMEKLSARRPPTKVMQEAEALNLNIRFVLSEWEDIQSYPEHQQNMMEIINIYSPKIINAYCDAPDPNLDAVVDSVTDSLSTLNAAVARIRRAIVENNVRELDSHAQTLRERFGNLPGLDDYQGELDQYDGKP